MATLELLTSSASTYEQFLSFMRANMVVDGVTVLNSATEWGNCSFVLVDGNDQKIYNERFSRFTFTEYNNTNMIIYVGANYNNNGIFIAPLLWYTSDHTQRFRYLYSTSDHPKTVFCDKTGSTVLADFKLFRYIGKDVIYFGFDNTQNSISKVTLRHIDDSTKTKCVLIVTDSSGMVSIHDTSTKAYSWKAYSSTFQNPNTGKSTAINAYKYIMQGWYCDELYYFDGGMNIPADGISKMGDNKFLKLGNSNFFIKMI